MENNSHSETQTRVTVDVIVPVFNERPEAIEATLDACLAQKYPVSRIFVVDDGSTVPATIPPRIETTGKVSLTRLPQNVRNAAARNAGIAQSSATLLACVNCEVLPAPDWLETCARYLSGRSDVGVCFTKTVPDKPDSLLSRWRMRFQETKFGPETGSAHFAPGHAVVFRREAVERVGRYNNRLGNVSEDSDICERIRAAGLDTHFLADSYCISIQHNTVTEFAKKELSRNDWDSPKDYSLSRLFLDRSRWMLIRMGRNLVKGRLLFLPVDAAVWFTALKIAVSKTLAFRNAPGARPLDTSRPSD